MGLEKGCRKRMAECRKKARVQEKNAFRESKSLEKRGLEKEKVQRKNGFREGRGLLNKQFRKQKVLGDEQFQRNTSLSTIGFRKRGIRDIRGLKKVDFRRKRLQRAKCFRGQKVFSSKTVLKMILKKKKVFSNKEGLRQVTICFFVANCKIIIIYMLVC